MASFEVLSDSDDEPTTFPTSAEPAAAADAVPFAAATPAAAEPAEYPTAAEALAPPPCAAAAEPASMEMDLISDDEDETLPASAVPAAAPTAPETTTAPADSPPVAAPCAAAPTSDCVDVIMSDDDEETTPAAAPAPPPLTPAEPPAPEPRSSDVTMPDDDGQTTPAVAPTPPAPTPAEAPAPEAAPASKATKAFGRRKSKNQPIVKTAEAAQPQATEEVTMPRQEATDQAGAPAPSGEGKPLGTGLKAFGRRRPTAPKVKLEKVEPAATNSVVTARESGLDEAARERDATEAAEPLPNAAAQRETELRVQFHETVKQLEAVKQARAEDKTKYEEQVVREIEAKNAATSLHAEAKDGLAVLQNRLDESLKQEALSQQSHRQVLMELREQASAEAHAEETAKSLQDEAAQREAELKTRLHGAVKQEEAAEKGRAEAKAQLEEHILHANDAKHAAREAAKREVELKEHLEESSKQLTLVQQRHSETLAELQEQATRECNAAGAARSLQDETAQRELELRARLEEVCKQHEAAEHGQSEAKAEMEEQAQRNADAKDAARSEAAAKEADLKKKLDESLKQSALLAQSHRQAMVELQEQAAQERIAEEAARSLQDEAAQREVALTARLGKIMKQEEAAEKGRTEVKAELAEQVLCENDAARSFQVQAAEREEELKSRLDASLKQEAQSKQSHVQALEELQEQCGQVRNAQEAARSAQDEAHRQEIELKKRLDELGKQLAASEQGEAEARAAMEEQGIREADAQRAAMSLQGEATEREAALRSRAEESSKQAALSEKSHRRALAELQEQASREKDAKDAAKSLQEKAGQRERALRTQLDQAVKQLETAQRGQAEAEASDAARLLQVETTERQAELKRRLHESREMELKTQHDEVVKQLKAAEHDRRKIKAAFEEQVLDNASADDAARSLRVEAAEQEAQLKNRLDESLKELALSKQNHKQALAELQEQALQECHAQEVARSLQAKAAQREMALQTRFDDAVKQLKTVELGQSEAKAEFEEQAALSEQGRKRVLVELQEQASLECNAREAARSLQDANAKRELEMRLQLDQLVNQLKAAEQGQAEAKAAFDEQVRLDTDVKDAARSFKVKAVEQEAELKNRLDESSKRLALSEQGHKQALAELREQATREKTARSLEAEAALRETQLRTRLDEAVRQSEVAQQARAEVRAALEEQTSREVDAKRAAESFQREAKQQEASLKSRLDESSEQRALFQQRHRQALAELREQAAQECNARKAAKSLQDERWEQEVELGKLRAEHDKVVIQLKAADRGRAEAKAAFEEQVTRGTDAEKAARSSQLQSAKREAELQHKLDEALQQQAASEQHHRQALAEIQEQATRECKAKEVAKTLQDEAAQQVVELQTKVDRVVKQLEAANQEKAEAKAVFEEKVLHVKNDARSFEVGAAEREAELKNGLDASLKQMALSKQGHKQALAELQEQATLGCASQQAARSFQDEAVEREMALKKLRVQHDEVVKRCEAAEKGRAEVKAALEEDADAKEAARSFRIKASQQEAALKKRLDESLKQRVLSEQGHRQVLAELREQATRECNAKEAARYLQDEATQQEMAMRKLRTRLNEVVKQEESAEQARVEAKSEIEAQVALGIDAKRAAEILQAEAAEQEAELKQRLDESLKQSALSEQSQRQTLAELQEQILQECDAKEAIRSLQDESAQQEMELRALRTRFDKVAKQAEAAEHAKAETQAALEEQVLQDVNAKHAFRSFEAKTAEQEAQLKKRLEDSLEQMTLSEQGHEQALAELQEQAMEECAIKEAAKSFQGESAQREMELRTRFDEVAKQLEVAEQGQTEAKLALEKQVRLNMNVKHAAKEFQVEAAEQQAELKKKLDESVQQMALSEQAHTQAVAEFQDQACQEGKATEVARLLRDETKQQEMELKTRFDKAAKQLEAAEEGQAVLRAAYEEQVLHCTDAKDAAKSFQIEAAEKEADLKRELEASVKDLLQSEQSHKQAVAEFEQQVLQECRAREATKSFQEEAAQQEMELQTRLDEVIKQKEAAERAQAEVKAEFEEQAARHIDATHAARSIQAEAAEQAAELKSKLDESWKHLAVSEQSHRQALAKLQEQAVEECSAKESAEIELKKLRTRLDEVDKQLKAADSGRAEAAAALAKQVTLNTDAEHAAKSFQLQAAEQEAELTKRLDESLKQIELFEKSNQQISAELQEQCSRGCDLEAAARSLQDKAAEQEMELGRFRAQLSEVAKQLEIAEDRQAETEAAFQEQVLQDTEAKESARSCQAEAAEKEAQLKKRLDDSLKQVALSTQGHQEALTELKEKAIQERDAKKAARLMEQEAAQRETELRARLEEVVLELGAAEKGRAEANQVFEEQARKRAESEAASCNEALAKERAHAASVHKFQINKERFENRLQLIRQMATFEADRQSEKARQTEEQLAQLRNEMESEARHAEAAKLRQNECGQETQEMGTRLAQMQAKLESEESSAALFKQHVELKERAAAESKGRQQEEAEQESRAHLKVKVEDSAEQPVKEEQYGPANSIQAGDFRRKESQGDKSFVARRRSQGAAPPSLGVSYRARSRSARLEKTASASAAATHPAALATAATDVGARAAGDGKGCPTRNERNACREHGTANQAAGVQDMKTVGVQNSEASAAVVQLKMPVARSVRVSPRAEQGTASAGEQKLEASAAAVQLQMPAARSVSQSPYAGQGAASLRAGLQTVEASAAAVPLKTPAARSLSEGPRIEQGASSMPAAVHMPLPRHVSASPSTEQGTANATAGLQSLAASSAAVNLRMPASRSVSQGGRITAAHPAGTSLFEQSSILASEKVTRTVQAAQAAQVVVEDVERAVDEAHINLARQVAAAERVVQTAEEEAAAEGDSLQVPQATSMSLWSRVAQARVEREAVRLVRGAHGKMMLCTNHAEARIIEAKTQAQCLVSSAEVQVEAARRAALAASHERETRAEAAVEATQTAQYLACQERVALSERLRVVEAQMESTSRAARAAEELRVGNASMPAALAPGITPHPHRGQSAASTLQEAQEMALTAGQMALSAESLARSRPSFGSQASAQASLQMGSPAFPLSGRFAASSSADDSMLAGQGVKRLRLAIGGAALSRDNIAGGALAATTSALARSQEAQRLCAEIEATSRERRELAFRLTRLRTDAGGVCPKEAANDLRVAAGAWQQRKQTCWKLLRSLQEITHMPAEQLVDRYGLTMDAPRSEKALEEIALLGTVNW